MGSCFSKKPTCPYNKSDCSCQDKNVCPFLNSKCTWKMCDCYKTSPKESDNNSLCLYKQSKCPWKPCNCKTI